MKGVFYGDHGNDNNRDKEKRLKGIRPHNGFDTRFIGIEPDEQQQDDNGHEIGDVQAVEKGVLQDLDRQQQSESCAERLRYQEKQRPGFIGHIAKADFQISINGNQFQFIIDGRKHKGYKEITYNSAQDKLKIVQAVVPNVPRDRNEGNR